MRTVIRRVGGLEVIHFDKFFLVAVIRRVGGLEGRVHRCLCAGKVIRWEGGSSPHPWGCFFYRKVTIKNMKAPGE